MEMIKKDQEGGSPTEDRRQKQNRAEGINGVKKDRNVQKKIYDLKRERWEKYGWKSFKKS